MADHPTNEAIPPDGVWLAPGAAAARIGYPDAAGLSGFLGHYGYGEAERPSGHACACGVVRRSEGAWLWLEDFLTLLAKAAGMAGGDALCRDDTPDCIGRDLARAIGDILLRRAPWKSGAAWRAFASSPDAALVGQLRFGSLAELARERGPDGALAAAGPALGRLKAACDPSDPVAADAVAAIADCLDRLGRIGRGHPLVRYGILRGADPMALAA